jgi:hypothetical protein
MIQEVGNPINWCLLKRSSGPVMKEAVFTMQGIIGRTAKIVIASDSQIKKIIPVI